MTHFLFFSPHSLERVHKLSGLYTDTSSLAISEYIPQILQRLFNPNILHLLNKRFHNALANLYSHTFLLEHIQTWQEFLLKVQIHKQVKLGILQTTHQNNKYFWISLISIAVLVKIILIVLED